MREAGKQVVRFWPNPFVERNAKQFTLHQAIFLETDRHTVNPDEIRTYFNCCKDQLKTIPSVFVWNTAETQVGTPNVIVSSPTGSEPITVPKIRDDSQLTLLTTISTFSDSTPPFFVSKNKTFEKDRLVERKMYKGHDYMIRAVSTTCMTEVLFINWLQIIFLISHRMVFAHTVPKEWRSACINHGASNFSVAHVGLQTLNY
jgi:hypothetical protein